MKRRLTDNRRTTAVLAAHADGLIGRPEAIRQMGVTDQEREELAPLFQVAEQLHQVMRPVQPSAAFVRSLGKELTLNARRQIAATKQVRKRLLIGAAAVGSLVSVASVVGAIVFFIARWRARSHARTV